MRRRMLWCCLLLGFAGTPWQLGALAGDDGTATYSALDFDRRLADYCGLLSDQARRGFLWESAALSSRLGLSEQQLQQARIDAILALDRGWTNYNKAGKAQWCAGAGRAAAARLEGLSPQRDAESER